MTHQYEAMFLFDPGFGGDMSKAENEIRRLMNRAEAEIVFCRKWDERKLAYEIKGRKRGVYVLVYFRAAVGKIPGIERDAQISEPILRVLILRADGVTPEAMECFVRPMQRVVPEPVAKAAAPGGETAPPKGAAEERAEAVAETTSVAVASPSMEPEAVPVVEDNANP